MTTPKPGRELDREVCRIVCGNTRPQRVEVDDVGMSFEYRTPNVSTDTKEAVYLLQWLENRTEGLGGFSVIYPTQGRWSGHLPRYGNYPGMFVQGETFAHAVCLLVLEVSKREIHRTTKRYRTVVDATKGKVER